MPKIPSIVTKEIILPSSGARLEVGYTYGDILEINNVFQDSFTVGVEDNAIDKKLAVTGKVLSDQQKMKLECGIKSWDFTDDNDKPLPITIDNIYRIDPQDGLFLMQELEKCYNESPTDEQKKKSKNQ